MDAYGSDRVLSSEMGEDKKILIVDDERTILTLLQLAFDREGYTVRTALSGEAALEMLREEESRVMFLDLRLPGMNGLELCASILKAFPEASIYAITGYPTKFELQDCMEVGFRGYFTKPPNIELLLNTVRYAFENPGKPG